jgi:Lon protease-like protein
VHDTSSSFHANVPLLELGANILPGESISLRIFEKDLSLLSYCLGENKLNRQSNFALSLATHKSVENIGCLVEIENVLKLFKNKDKNKSGAIIAVRGLCRYRILEKIEGNSFTTANIRFIEDLEEKIDPGLSKEVCELFKTNCSEKLAFDFGPTSSSSLLSYQLAVHLDLEQAERQILLKQPSEQARIEALCQMLYFRTKMDKFNPGLYATSGYIQ